MKKTSNRNKDRKPDDRKRANHTSTRSTQKPDDRPRKRKREGCGAGSGGGPVAVAGIRG